METLESKNDVISISDSIEANFKWKEEKEESLSLSDSIEANEDWKSKEDTLSLSDSVTKLFTNLPTGFSVSQGSYHSKVAITWDEVDDATNYRIYRDGSLLVETSDLSYDDITADKAELNVDGLTANQYPTRVDLSLDNFYVKTNEHDYQISVYKDGVWSGLSSALQGWRGYSMLDIKWYKDDGSGYSLISDSNTFSISHYNSPNPPVPETIDSEDVIVEETSNYIKLEWPEATSNTPSTEPFKVTINANGCDEIESSPLSTGKSSAPILFYRIKRNGTTIIDDLEGLSYEDYEASGSSGSNFEADASDGTHSTKVVLGLTYDSETPESETYTISSYNVSGWSDDCNDISASKTTGDIDIQWQVGNPDDYLDLSDGTDLELKLPGVSELDKLEIAGNFVDIPGATTDDYDYLEAPLYPTKKYYRVKITNQNGEISYSTVDEGWRAEGSSDVTTNTDTLTFTDSITKTLINGLVDSLELDESFFLNIGGIAEGYVSRVTRIFLTDSISYFIGVDATVTLEDFVDFSDDVSDRVLVPGSETMSEDLELSDSIEITLNKLLNEELSLIELLINKSMKEVYGYRTDKANFFVPNSSRGFYTIIYDILRHDEVFFKGRLYNLLDELNLYDWQLFQAELIGGPLEIYSKANKILQPAENETKVDLFEVKKIFVKWFGKDAEDLFSNLCLAENRFVQPSKDVVLNSLVGTLPSLKGDDMKAAITDLTIERGAFYKCEFIYKDIEDNFVDLSYFDVDLIITDYRRNLEVLRVSSKTPDSSETITKINKNDDGMFQVIITASDTAKLVKSKYKYDIDITLKEDSEKVDRILKGILEVL